MPSDTAWQARVSALESELAALRLTVRALETRVEELEGFELVPAPSTAADSTPVQSPGTTTSRAHIPEGEVRDRILDQIGGWLAQRAQGYIEGTSGRELLPGPSRHYIVLKDYFGASCNCILSPWSEVEKLVKRSGSLGQAVFVGVPRWADVERIARRCDIDIPHGSRASA